MNPIDPIVSIAEALPLLATLLPAWAIVLVIFVIAVSCIAIAITRTPRLPEVIWSFRRPPK